MIFRIFFENADLQNSCAHAVFHKGRSFENNLKICKKSMKNPCKFGVGEKTLKNRLKIGFGRLWDSTLEGFGRAWDLSWPLLGAFWVPLGVFWAPFGASWVPLGGSWGALGRSWGGLGTTCKNHQKFDAKNDRFGHPKASQNDSKIDPQIDQKSMQKTMRKKNRYRTNIRPSQ